MPAPDEVVIEGQLPSLGWHWSDGKIDRYSQGTNLLSGIDIDKEGSVQSRVQVDGNSIITTTDMSDSLLFCDAAYRHFFRDVLYDPLYDKDHSKIVAMREAIREVKGDSDSNKVLFVQKQDTCGLVVEKELIPQTVVRQKKEKDGSIITVAQKQNARAFNIGNKTNPQGMVHIEAAAPSSGFWNTTNNPLNDFTFDNKRPDGGGFGGGSTSAAKAAKEAKEDVKMDGTAEAASTFWNNFFGRS
jgi:hypothetical protein